MKTINIITLGCAKNIVDSEHLAAQMPTNLYNIVFDKDEPADIVCINTCGFILDAKEESINTILQAALLRRAGKIKKLYVFGCLSERYKDALRDEIPEVDAFFGARTLDDIVRELRVDKYDPIARTLSTPAHYAYLKISEGCNWGCGYCAIPLIRGKHRSVPIENLIQEAKNLANQGVKEIMVIAQDTTYYGVDIYGERRLAELLRRLCEIEGIEWIRLHYAYPAQFPEEVLDVMREEPKMCKYLDIPLQHISDAVLTGMRRGLSKNETCELVDKLRERVPGIALRTTLLVGYPGENEADYEELLAFVREKKFERLGVFPYSQEEGTFSAETMEDNVTQEVKEARAEGVMALQREISLNWNASRVGQRVRVVIDRSEGDFWVGRSQYDSPEVDGECFVTSSETLEVGSFYEVEITKAADYDLYARLT